MPVNTDPSSLERLIVSIPDTPTDCYHLLWRDDDGRLVELCRYFQMQGHRPYDVRYADLSDLSLCGKCRRTKAKLLRDHGHLSPTASGRIWETTNP